MPQSRKRKKNRKTHRPKKYDEVYDGGWYEVARRGRNVFQRLKMTEEQYQEWMKQIQENVPKFYEEIKGKIEKVVALINQYDKIFVVGGVASVAMVEGMANPEEDTSDPETSIEYCQSIALATANTNSGVIPSIEQIKDIYEQLKQIKSDFGWYYKFQYVGTDDSDIKSTVRSNMIGETMNVRGEGYLKHIEELFHELFTPHDAIFQKHYGFSSSDIIRTLKRLEYSFCLRVTSPDGQPHPTLLYELNKWQLSRNGDQMEFVRKNPGLAIENGLPALYSPLNIPDTEKLYRIRHFDETQEKVVKALTLELGDNSVFAEHSPFEIMNESRIFTNPIVKGSNGNYYLFSMNIGARNYQGIAINLLKKADSDYFNKSFMNNRVLISKDNFVESKVLSLFKKMLPGVQFFSNLKYDFLSPSVDIKCARSKDGKYELDILGISDETTFLIETKAGLLNEKSKRGATLSLHSDLTKLIGDAICQSYRAYRYVVDESDSFFKASDGSIIRPRNRTNVQRISVSFSYVGGLMTSLSKLHEFGVIEKNTEFAWTVNIHDLIAFSEIIASEDELLDYLHKRIPLYYDKRLVNLDEVALLGLYYHEDLRIHKDFKKTGTIMLNTKSYTREFDDYFESNGPKPKRNKKFK